MNLFLDLGNSRIKWAFADPAFDAHRVLAWEQALQPDGLRDIWSSGPRPARVLGACVTSSERQLRIDHVLQDLGWPRAEWLRSPARCGSLVNAYRDPQALGIDRFLAMLAAFEGGHAPFVIASCGSAMTLDAVAATGQHLGGQILPGSEAMRVAMRVAAPGLPDFGQGDHNEFATNTSDAMRAGAGFPLAATIERFAQATATRLQREPQVLLCGGNAEHVGTLLRRGWQLLPAAVLQGLGAWQRCQADGDQGMSGSGPFVVRSVK